MDEVLLLFRHIILGGDQGQSHVENDGDGPYQAAGNCLVEAGEPVVGVIELHVISLFVLEFLARIELVQEHRHVDNRKDTPGRKARKPSPFIGALPGRTYQQGTGNARPEVLLNGQGQAEQIYGEVVNTHLPHNRNTRADDDQHATHHHQVQLAVILLAVAGGEESHVDIVGQDGGEGVDGSGEIGHDGGQEAGDHQSLETLRKLAHDQ